MAYDQSAIDPYVSSGAHSAAQGAGNAVQSLHTSFFSGTEPNLATLVPTYNRMLAIALLLAGAFVGMALIERNLGGPRGAGWSVIPRTLAAVIAAVIGLSVVEYAAGYANLLAHAWDISYVEHGLNLAQKIQSAYSHPASAGQALGSALGLILTGLFTMVLVMLIAIELVIRSALILTTTAFLPLVCVMAIWPRLSPVLSHLVEFLVAVLLSKFVIVTAVYIGFSMVASGYGAPKSDTAASDGMVIGLATLLIALFSPIVLLQGIRFTHTASASAVRGWGAAGIGAASAVALRGLASRGARRAAQPGLGKRAGEAAKQPARGSRT
jgi:hypothetical protein